MTSAATPDEQSVAVDARPLVRTASVPATRRSASTAAHRADVDGLRAVAVALAIAFHLDVAPSLRGGFVGVDVFFVISGFLITGLLLRELHGGPLSLLGFYERRVRRIVPALTACVALVLLAGLVLLLPGDYRQAGRSALWALGAASNFFFLDNTGYFDAAASSMPLLHTWSLGVEEQFYFVWPLLLLVLFRASRGRTAIVGLGLLGVVVASFVANVQAIGSEPKAAFFLLQTRAWELGAGGLLALCPVLGRGRGRDWIAEALPVAGLALIARAAATLSSDRPYPGWDALLPVVGAMLVVYPSGRETLASRLLGAPPLAFVGRVSYSLYLVNWPLIVYWRLYTSGSSITPTAAAAIVIVSLVLAWASWRWVEQPFRRPAVPRRSVFARAALAAGVVASAAWAVVATDGAAMRIPGDARALGDRDVMWKWSCPGDPPTDLPAAWRFPGAAGPCVVGAPWQSARTRAVLWGDSFAEHLLPLLDLAGRDTGTSIVLIVPCAAVFDDATLRRSSPQQPQYNAQCAAKRAATSSYLREHHEVRLVMLASAWASLVDLLQGSDGRPLPRKDGIAALGAALDRLVEEVDAPGRRVLLIGDTPRVPIPDPSACAVAEVSPLLRDCPPDLGVVAWTNMIAAVRPLESMLAEVAGRHANAAVYLPSDHLCADGRCDVEVDGAFLYRDAAHLRRNLTPEAVRAIVSRLELTELLRSITSAAPGTPAASGSRRGRSFRAVARRASVSR